MASYGERYHGAGDGAQVSCQDCGGNGWKDDPKIYLGDRGEGLGHYDMHVPATCKTCSGSGWNPF